MHPGCFGTIMTGDAFTGVMWPSCYGIIATGAECMGIMGTGNY